MVELSQAAKDLLWVVNSPSFCEGTDVAPPMPLVPEQIDQTALGRFMADRAEHRVGRYFEHLLLFWLSHVREVEIVGSGIQIRDGKRTIGEIDYLYRDEAGVLTHCEASVKFFLHHPRPSTSHFPGPNATDNFERKITKLFDQQLQLSRSHYRDVEQRHAFVKGMAFYHPTVAEPLQLPDRMPQDHSRGGWLRASELDLLCPNNQGCGTIKDKPFWLAPNSSAACVSIPELREQLRAHFVGARPHPVMVSVRDNDGIEAQRLFVVPDIWPARLERERLPETNE